MTRLYCILFTLTISLCVFGQRKEIGQARDNIKKNTDLDNAEQLMTNLLKDSTNRDNNRIWTTLFRVLEKKYDQGNEKLFLKQEYDTTSLFVLCRRMFDTWHTIDSVNALPQNKHKLNGHFVDRNVELLNEYRVNLFNGGIYFISKDRFPDAYSFFDTYINCAQQPYFYRYKYNETDKNIPQAAYWAVYCAYKMKDNKAVLKNTYLALKDTAHYKYMLQYLAETYKSEDDTTRYVQALSDGFDKYPRYPFFFIRLIDYYSSNNQLDKAMTITDRALKVYSTSIMFRLTKSSLLLNVGKYSECITLADSLIAQNDSLSGAYLNAGLAYYNMAVKANVNVKVSQKNKSKILSYYKQSLPYMQRYRQLEPEEKSKWGVPLYTIYLNLNMGKEFDEIDNLLRN